MVGLSNLLKSIAVCFSAGFVVQGLCVAARGSVAGNLLGFAVFSMFAGLAYWAYRTKPSESTPIILLTGILIITGLALSYLDVMYWLISLVVS
jgi:hypothetical protein